MGAGPSAAEHRYAARLNELQWEQAMLEAIAVKLPWLAIKKKIAAIAPNGIDVPPPQRAPLLQAPPHAPACTRTAHAEPCMHRTRARERTRFYHSMRSCTSTHALLSPHPRPSW